MLDFYLVGVVFPPLNWVVPPGLDRCYFVIIEMIGKVWYAQDIDWGCWGKKKKLRKKLCFFPSSSSQLHFIVLIPDGRKSSTPIVSTPVLGSIFPILPTNMCLCWQMCAFAELSHATVLQLGANPKCSDVSICDAKMVAYCVVKTRSWVLVCCFLAYLASLRVVLWLLWLASLQTW